jgi:general secretion pathway protein J
MRARRKDRGLTLIEVLVAISLLSLLSVGLLTAWRVGATAWERTHSRLMLDRRIATANAIFHSALEGILPAIAYFQADPRTTPSSFLFFQGQPASMRFITAYSLEGGSRGGLRLVELQVVGTERGKRVLLNDFPYGGPRAAGRLVTGMTQDPRVGEILLTFAPIEPSPASFVIADELENCVFSYLIPEGFGQPARWTPAWTRPTQLPEAVSIQIAARSDPARLGPVTITVPIRASFLSP